MTTMNFDVEISRTEWSETDIWSSARELLRERMYGGVRVGADWSVMAESGPSVRVPLEVTDERQDGDARDLPAYVELFLHDVFLILNIAAPGSFGGTIAAAKRELSLDPRLFLYAGMDALPLQDVLAWYDSLELGTSQLATSPMARALFHLLHLSSGPEDDVMTVLRLAQAVEGLGLSPESLLALRGEVVRGTAPVVHPLHDESLDERLEDDALDWTRAVDEGMALLLGEIRNKLSSP
jgi:hypothetical protein